MTGRQDLESVERWFVDRGVPHLIDHYSARTDIWTRALPLLLVAYVVGGFQALDLYGWSLAKNLGAAAIVIAVVVLSWVIANLVLRRPWFDVPKKVGWVELIAFVIGPSIPSLIFSQYGDAVQAAVTGLVVLAVIYLGTSYAVVPMLRWAIGRALNQIRSIASLIVRALPLLLLFATFLFISAEVWQVAGTLEGPAYWLTLSIFFGLGTLFVISRVPPLMTDLATFTSWTEVHESIAETPAVALGAPTDGSPVTEPLRIRQKLNVALLMLFGQALQITLVVILLTGFFVLFGFLAISEATAQSWTLLDDVHVYARLDLGQRTLVISEPLLRVSGFLGAFSGMYFTVVSATDATYRDEFAEDVRPEVHRLFAVQAAYRWALGNDLPSEDMPSRN